MWKSGVVVMVLVKHEGGQEEGEEKRQAGPRWSRGREEGQENKMCCRSGSKIYEIDYIVLLLISIKRKCIYTVYPSPIVFFLSITINIFLYLCGVPEISTYTKIQYIVL